MLKSKFIKSVVLGTCLTLLSSGVALAGEGGGQSSYSGQSLPMDMVEYLESDPHLIIDRPLYYLDNGASDFIPEPEERSFDYKEQYLKDYSKEIYEKHMEIDKYVFKEHAEEIKKMGFTVTHTGPHDDYVEIGITPFSTEKADYLYGLFGRDMVKVVEGQQARLLVGSIDPSNGIEPETRMKTEPKINNEENANYFYGTDGKGIVKIVEGEQAKLYEETTAIANDLDLEVDVISTVSIEDDQASKTRSSKSPIIYTIGAFMIIGGGLIVTNRFKK